MAHTFAMVGVPSGDTTRQTFIEVVSANYFDAFDALGTPLAAGRAFTRASLEGVERLEDVEGT
jgi:hypothetical protein